MKAFETWLKEFNNYEKENLPEMELEYKNYVLYEKYPIMQKLDYERVFLNYITREDKKFCGYIKENCDNWFGIILQPNDMREIAKYFNELADCIDEKNKEK